MAGHRVKGKTALVTGGASGIGAASARLLCEEGAEVIITDIAEPADRDEFRYIRHDISSEGDWKRVMNTVCDDFGGIDILVNSAGINGVSFKKPQDPEHLSLDQFMKVMSVNGAGTFLGCKHGIAAMKEQGGAIVNIGSLSARLIMPGMFDYAASKAVIRYLTNAVALYCAENDYDIRCNLVTPGATYTPLWESIFEESADRAAAEEEVRLKIPLKKWVMPEDVAAAVLYLASDEAGLVTGTEIVVDGGQRVKGQVTRGRKE